MAEKNVHDEGIQRRIEEIWKKEKSHLIAVIPNVEYRSYPIITGEIDILKLYSYGAIGIEEVKSTAGGMMKAQKQLERAANVFKFYKPEMFAYIIKDDVVIDYGTIPF